MSAALAPAQASRPVHDAALLAAIPLLLKIFSADQSGSGSAFAKAIPWPCLQAMGLSESQVQELLAAGHLQHLLETTPSAARGRTFRETRSAALGPRSCFVLTASGSAYAQQWFLRREEAAGPPSNQPRWNRETGELWLDGTLLKRFRHVAANQRFLLDALQAAGWPSCIPNPFRSANTPKPKKCLHRTIESLNEGLSGTPRLRFGGDGQGGLRWERVI